MTTPTPPEMARKIADWHSYSPAKTALLSLADQVEALTAELESYKKDAERYRAIREGLEVDENSGIVVSLVDDFGGETLDSEVADKAIDAAIAKGTA